LLEGIILFVSILAFNLAAGITFRRWIKFFAQIWHFIAKCGALIWYLIKKIANVREFKEFKELNPSYLQTKMQIVYIIIDIIPIFIRIIYIIQIMFIMIEIIISITFKKQNINQIKIKRPEMLQ
jgi:hypothetical protein